MNWKIYLVELVVVFLGITAAFALDSWAKSREAQHQAEQYLQGLYNDLQSDEAVLSELVLQFNRNGARMQRMIGMMRTGKIDNDSIGVYMMHMNTLAKFEPNKATWLSMTNSGNLGLIDDFKLRRKIAAYYQHYESAKLVDDVGMRYVNENVFPFMFRHMEMYKAEFADPDVLRTLEFRNIVSGYTFLMHQSGNFYQQTLDSCRVFREYLATHLGP